MLSFFHRFCHSSVPVILKMLSFLAELSQPAIENESIFFLKIRIFVKKGEIIMATIKITIDLRRFEGKALLDYLYSLANKSKFIKIESIDEDAKKREFLEETKKSLQEVKLAQAGKKKLKSAKKFINEL